MAGLSAGDEPRDARGRWTRKAAGAVGGALVAGGVANLALRGVAARRHGELRQLHRAVVAPVVAADELKRALIGKRQALYGNKIAREWPVPALRATLYQRIREAKRHFRTAEEEPDWVHGGVKPVDEAAWDEHYYNLSDARRRLDELSGAKPDKRIKVAPRQYRLSPHLREIAGQPSEDALPDRLRERLQDIRQAREAIDEQERFEDAERTKNPDPYGEDNTRAFEKARRRLNARERKIKAALAKTREIAVNPDTKKLHAAKAHIRRKAGSLSPKTIAGMRFQLSQHLRRHTEERLAGQAERHAVALGAARQSFRTAAEPILRWYPGRRARLLGVLAAGALGAVLGGQTVASKRERLRKAEDAEDDLGPDDNSEAIAAIADDGHPAIAEKLASAFRVWKDDVAAGLLQPNPPPLLRAVHDDLDRATRGLHDIGMRAAAIPPAGVTPSSGGDGDATDAAGETDLPDRDPRGVAFSLRSTAPTPSAYLAQVRQDKIAELGQGQRETIRDILLESAKAGASPDEMAARIRRNIGLTSYQAGAVENYMQDLIHLNGRALTRELRDKRYDSLVRRNLEDGTPLTVDQINRLTDAYHRKYLAYRAMTIARTEGVGFANNGHIAGVRAILEAHPELEVIKTWNARRDKVTRPDHFDQHGTSIVGLDTPFVMKSGDKIAWPHQPGAKAKQVINCRCFCATRFVPKQHAHRLIADIPQPLEYERDAA